MTILKRLVVKAGQYEQNGETKNRYKTIGHIHDGQYGKYITLDASVNLAAFPRREGDDRVTVNVYVYEPRAQQQSASGGSKGSAGASKPFGSDEDIPL